MRLLYSGKPEHTPLSSISSHPPCFFHLPLPPLPSLSLSQPPLACLSDKRSRPSSNQWFGPLFLYDCFMIGKPCDVACYLERFVFFRKFLVGHFIILFRSQLSCLRFHLYCNSYLHPVSGIRIALPLHPLFAR
ncbi:hypothetical protein ES708_00737 [subsurface metagenome]